ncbi:unnamed protein product [Blepharisma stoltei]|uniref:FGFR1 oncogene partner (FOP) N-terminal dimerisation domain-containing protein n=1 Tax=Blepharisma stoltei TaxID=1481888 RepID=A0AAU9JI30_9CILI|nr:unnamed protein product [Blepharisma stoltei]
MEDLKELVIETLDNNGILDTIRAQLRSSVFNALQQEQAKAGGNKTEAQKVMETEPGQLCSELFRDFLQNLGMVHTLNVWLPECKLPEEPKDRSFIENKLNIKGDNNPLIYQVIKKFKESQSQKQESKEPEELKPPASEERPKTIGSDEQEYTDDFDEIDEDIEIEGSLGTGGRDSHGPIGESGGSSMGIDQSVDSLALEDYDYTEKVKRAQK